jgi:hypothetical protein
VFVLCESYVVTDNIFVMRLYCVRVMLLLIIYCYVFVLCESYVVTDNILLCVCFV